MRLGRVVVAVGIVAVVVPAVPLARAEGPASPPPAGEWLAGDLHVHTTYSHDSYGGPGDDNTGLDEAYTAGLTVEQQFLVAASRGLDYLAITDHNDVRSQSDPGFGAGGVLGVRGYEKSLDGHAQMLGADHVYDSTAGVTAVRDELRADGGVFQINHPREGGEEDWGPGHTVVPDTVEVWNISRLYQPPLPSASDNDAAVRFWEGFLDAGHHVAATGGSDSHWASTVALQGAGNPTTWVLAPSRTEAGVLDGLRRGRTTISARPPAQGGALVFLEADGDGDGAFESVVGDTVPAGSVLRARVDGAPGAELRLITNGGRLAAPPVTVTGATFEHRFRVDDGTWVRAEVARPDLAAERGAVCGDVTTYCRNLLLVEAMTSALYQSPGVDVDVDVVADGGTVVLRNGLVERVWTLSPFRTERITELRTGRVRSGRSPDFRLLLDGVEIRSDSLSSRGPPIVERIAHGGVRVAFDLGALASRVVEMWPGVAGFRSHTVVRAPVVLSGYTLDEVAVGPGVSATAHSFRAGADWRSDPGWAPALAVGDANTGDWRRSVSGGVGAPLSEPGQWLTTRASDGDGRVFLVMERAHLPSSRVRYDGHLAAAVVDLSRDVIGLGPIEEQAHVQNPGPGPARHRLVAQAPLALEAVFTGVALDGDDEPWQHWAHLSRHRMPPWRPTVTFNTNNVDADRISTGAKDDVDFPTFLEQLDVARRLGVETFVFDDGWQARSGDWCPDSPGCPEPRADRFGHRFPDSSFAAVRAELDAAGMSLGLWMSPMHFHTSSAAYTSHPEWACTPAGDGTALVTALQPEEGSNEAGIGTWNPRAVGLAEHVEGRIRRAIEEYGARYFKFDFLAWLDCVDVAPADMYEYREAFVAMLDRLVASYPTVTFQIDETNDYRLFPFESIARGPSWFQNGTPPASDLLHNLWSLAPEVPGFTLGQHALGNADERAALPTDYLMAVALGSHVTFWSDLTTFTDEEIASARSWVDLYRTWRSRLAGFTYPLLADPAGGRTWTALQPWDRDLDRGMLLVYRQDAPEPERAVPLRGVRSTSRYVVRDVRSGSKVGEFSGSDLRAGALVVSLPSRHSAAVLSIDPV